MLLVTVTNKATGRYAIAYCKNEMDAGAFIDNMSEKIAEDGKVWWSITKVSDIKTYEE